MTIAIDFDGTFTADPELWVEFIKIARARGHKVVCVSCRRDCEENRLEMDVPGVLTYLTSGSSKSWFMEQLGVRVDIWCDDSPESVWCGR